MQGTVLCYSPIAKEEGESRIWEKKLAISDNNKDICQAF